MTDTNDSCLARAVQRCRDVLLAIATLLNIVLWFIGRTRWRGAPPEFSYFLIWFIIPLALGVGLGIGEFRQTERIRKICGFLSFLLTSGIVVWILIHWRRYGMSVYNE